MNRTVDGTIAYGRTRYALYDSEHERFHELAAANYEAAMRAWDRHPGWTLLINEWKIPGIADLHRLSQLKDPEYTSPIVL